MSPRVVDGSSLEVFKARLDKTLSSLVYWRPQSYRVAACIAAALGTKRCVCTVIILHCIKGKIQLWSAPT